MDENKLRAVDTSVEDPIPIIFWDPVEFVVALSVLGICLVFDMFMLGGFLAIMILAGARYMKRGAKKGAAPHYLWAIGLQFDPTLSKHFPPSWKNDYIE